MNIEIIIAVLSSSILTALITGLFNRRKNSVDIEDKINQMATRLIDDQREEIDSLNAHIVRVELQYKEGKAENERLKIEVEALKIIIEDYSQRLSDLNQSVRGLSG